MAQFFTVRWRRPRRVVPNQELNQYPATPPASIAQGFPAWHQSVDAHLFSSSIGLQRLPGLNEYPPTPSTSGGVAGLVPHFKTRWLRSKTLITQLPLADFPASPDPPTAQGFPSWELERTINRYSNVSPQRVPELNEFPATSLPPGGVAGLIPHFKTRWLKQKKLVLQLPLNEFPAPPDLPTSEEFPAWELIKSNRIGFSFKLQQVELNEFPGTPTAQGFPAWKLVKSNKVGFSFTAQITRLDEYPYPPDEYPSWVAPKSIRSKFVRDRQRLPELNIYPATPLVQTAQGFPAWKLVETFKFGYAFKLQRLELNEYPATLTPPGGVAGLVPHFKTIWSSRRKLLKLPSVIDVQPAAPSPGVYPSWKELKSLNVNFELGRVPHIGQASFPLAPDLPSYIAPSSFKINFKRKHLKTAELNSYPQAPPVTAQGFPSWKAAEGFRVRFDIKRQKPLDLSTYPKTPIPARYPSYLEPLIFRTAFKRNHLEVLELNEYPQIPPTPATLHAFIAKESFKWKFKRRNIEVLELNVYPETPPTPATLQAFLAGESFKWVFRRRHLKVLELNEYPEALPRIAIEGRILKTLRSSRTLAAQTSSRTLTAQTPGRTLNTEEP